MDIEVDVWDEVTQRCIAQKVTKGSFVNKALKRELEREAKRAKKSTKYDAQTTRPGFYRDAFGRVRKRRD